MLLFIVNHSLTLVVPVFATRCTTLCYTLSLIVIRRHSLFYWFSFFVSRCHLMHHLSVFLQTIVSTHQNSLDRFKLVTLQKCNDDFFYITNFFKRGFEKVFTKLDYSKTQY